VPCPYQDGTGISYPSIEAPCVDGCIQVFSTVSGRFNNIDTFCHRVGNSGKFRIPIFDGNVALLLVVGAGRIRTWRVQFN
jgi:hypothetical protein